MNEEPPQWAIDLKVQFDRIAEAVVKRQPPPPAPDDLFTREEAATKLRVSVSTFDRIVKAGTIKPAFNFEPLRFTCMALDHYIRTGGQPMELRQVRRRNATP